MLGVVAAHFALGGAHQMRVHGRVAIARKHAAAGPERLIVRVREAGQQRAAILEGAQGNAFDWHARMLPRALVPRNRCPARGRIMQ